MGLKIMNFLLKLSVITEILVLLFLLNLLPVVELKCKNFSDSSVAYLNFPKFQGIWYPLWTSTEPESRQCAIINYQLSSNNTYIDLSIQINRKIILSETLTRLNKHDFILGIESNASKTVVNILATDYHTYHISYYCRVDFIENEQLVREWFTVYGRNKEVEINYYRQVLKAIIEPMGFNNFNLVVIEQNNCTEPQRIKEEKFNFIKREQCLVLDSKVTPMSMESMKGFWYVMYAMAPSKDDGSDCVVVNATLQPHWYHQTVLNVTLKNAKGKKLEFNLHEESVSRFRSDKWTLYILDGFANLYYLAYGCIQQTKKTTAEFFAIISKVSYVSPEQISRAKNIVSVIGGRHMNLFRHKCLRINESDLIKSRSEILTNNPIFNNQSKTIDRSVRIKNT